MRIGFGYDTHQLVENRKLIIGGLTIPHAKGLLGHSDADVLSHAITDAILGALALGDIGTHFPDTDPTYKDANSIELLTAVNALIQNHGYKIGNIDSTLICEQPKIKPHVQTIQENIANALDITPNQVSIKATTNEKMGPEGREEGITCHAVALLLPL